MERTETTTDAHIDWKAGLGGTIVATAIGWLFTASRAVLSLSTVSAAPAEYSETPLRKHDPRPPIRSRRHYGGLRATTRNLA